MSEVSKFSGKNGLWKHTYLDLNHSLATYLICDSKEVTPEKAMAPHSSTLAWKIPWMEEPGGLQSMGLLRVRHD